MATLIALGVLALCCVLNSQMATRRGRSVGWWIVGAIVFGFFSTLLLWALPSVVPMQTCPECRSRIPLGATRCRYCRSSLVDDDEDDNPLPLRVARR